MTPVEASAYYAGPTRAQKDKKAICKGAAKQAEQAVAPWFFSLDDDAVSEMPLTKSPCARICGTMMIFTRILSFRRRHRFASGDRA
jgi:hypothetical protein